MESKNYAKALFEILLTKGVPEEDFCAIVRLFEFIESDYLLCKMLDDPTISFAEREEVITCFPSYLRGFLRLLSDNRKISIIKQITRHFRQYVNKKFGIEYVEITTSSELYNQDIINEFIKGKKCDIVHIIDNSIVGGYIIQLGNKTLDRSIIRYLKDLSSYMVG